MHFPVQQSKCLPFVLAVEVAKLKRSAAACLNFLLVLELYNEVLTWLVDNSTKPVRCLQLFGSRLTMEYDMKSNDNESGLTLTVLGCGCSSFHHAVSSRKLTVRQEFLGQPYSRESSIMLRVGVVYRREALRP